MVCCEIDDLFVCVDDVFGVEFLEVGDGGGGGGFDVDVFGCEVVLCCGDFFVGDGDGCVVGFVDVGECFWCVDWVVDVDGGCMCFDVVLVVGFVLVVFDSFDYWGCIFGLYVG